MPQREPTLDRETYDHITLRLLREWLYTSYSPEERARVLERVAWNVVRHPQSYLARTWRKIYRTEPATERRKPWMED